MSDERRIFGTGAGLLEEEWKESGVVYEDAPIEFQDEVIEEMLRNIIGKPEGDVYISELQGIHAIYCKSSVYFSNLQSSNGLLPTVTGEGIMWETKQPENLNDLAYCYNLQWLTIGFDVPSLVPLYDLPQLETIKFDGDSLDSLKKEVLEEIGNLPVLKRLSFAAKDQINVENITEGEFLIPLAERLTTLYAKGGIDWNPEILSQMTELEVLLIDYADDLSFLEYLPNLKKLSLYCCTAKDWSSLGSLENLEYLKIYGNMKMIVDIDLEDLSPLTKLDYLELLFTSINDEYSREEIINELPSLTGLVTQY
uniref:hypothetical protein n=1 Tax=Agathobacter sp. TaxID=2021311 RepID=UPI0040569CFB